MSQISVAANRGSINRSDLNWERAYDGMAAHSQSKIARGLVAVELITGVLSHPGVAPTGIGHIGGAPGTPRLYSGLRSAVDASRVRDESQHLVDVRFPTAADA